MRLLVGWFGFLLGQAVLFLRIPHVIICFFELCDYSWGWTIMDTQRSHMINRLAMRSIILLIPIFVVPAVAAVIIIKHFEMKGFSSILLIFAALGVSWLVVLWLLKWTRKNLASYKTSPE